MRGDVCLNLNLKRIQRQLINAGLEMDGFFFFFLMSNKLRDNQESPPALTSAPALCCLYPQANGLWSGHGLSNLENGGSERQGLSLLSCLSAVAVWTTSCNSDMVSKYLAAQGAWPLISICTC